MCMNFQTITSKKRLHKLWFKKAFWSLRLAIHQYKIEENCMSNYKVTNVKGKEIHTDISLHPGDILMDELEARNIAKSVFAEQLGIKPGHLSELLHGKRHVRAATALRLEKLLGIPAEYWMRVQVYYDLFTERSKERSVA